ncbi:hypothetical protein HZC27_03490 [Candidatus Roizmanbacteria bacterium]|nr:hypothetical protein [Candidatus Roizmanbacteria bacterium]
MNNPSLKELPRSYEYRRDIPTDDIYRDLRRWAVSFPKAVSLYLESFARRPFRTSIAGGLKNVDPKQDSIPDAISKAISHGFEGLQFVHDMDLHHKRANGLRAALITNNIDNNLLSSFGLNLTYAMNHSDFTDHGIPHVRRVHRVIDQIILRVLELRHRSSIERWLPALELFPHFHDMDQVMTMYRNKELEAQLIKERKPEEYEKRKLKPKVAHGLAAAVMTMALHKRYNEESGMTPSDILHSKQICATAALMMLKHEKPEGIDEAFRATLANGEAKRNGQDNKYWQDALNGYDLYDDFDKNRIDLFTLSPSQIISMMRDQKQKGGFMINGSKLGLDPQFEREYTAELQELFNDTNPIFSNISNEQRETFTLATKVAVFADEVEMVYPPYPSIMRSLKTDISRARPWWKTGATTEEILAAFNDVKRAGNLDENDPLASDSYRLLWESWNLMEKTRKAKENQVNDNNTFQLETAPYVNNVASKHVLMRLMAVRDIGERIMRSKNKESISQALSGIYLKRKESLTRKVLSRAEKVSAMEKVKLKVRPNEVLLKTLLRDREEADLLDQYGFRMRLLGREEEDLTDIIHLKPMSGQYDEGSIEEFLSF